tara:strand:+ start:11 stop:733 length:723 start_codon:yes stop_codon:yes gene_type:complete
MRICVSGTGSQGKSTFVNDFLKQWPDYITPKETYRDFIGDTHSKKTDKETQLKILNHMVDETMKHTEGDKVIFDRGPLDNIIYSIWANSKGLVDDDTVNEGLPLLRESLKFIDIVFFIPVTNVAPVNYDTDEFNESVEKGLTDESFLQEIDNLYKVLKYDWDNNPNTKFCDPHDRPPIIEIFGRPHERIEMVKWYIDVDGDLIDNVGVISQQEIEEMEQLKADLGVQDETSKAYRNPAGK